MFIHPYPPQSQALSFVTAVFKASHAKGLGAYCGTVSPVLSSFADSPKARTKGGKQQCCWNIV